MGKIISKKEFQERKALFNKLNNDLALQDPKPEKHKKPMPIDRSKLVTGRTNLEMNAVKKRVNRFANVDKDFALQNKDNVRYLSRKDY